MGASDDGAGLEGGDVTGAAGAVVGDVAAGVDRIAVGAGAGAAAGAQLAIKSPRIVTQLTMVNQFVICIEILRSLKERKPNRLMFRSRWATPGLVRKPGLDMFHVLVVARRANETFYACRPGHPEPAPMRHHRRRQLEELLLYLDNDLLSFLRIRGL